MTMKPWRKWTRDIVFLGYMTLLVLVIAGVRPEILAGNLPGVLLLVVAGDACLSAAIITLERPYRYPGIEKVGRASE